MAVRYLADTYFDKSEYPRIIEIIEIKPQKSEYPRIIEIKSQKTEYPRIIEIKPQKSEYPKMITNRN